jgi:hypothetical protein
LALCLNGKNLCKTGRKKENSPPNLMAIVIVERQNEKGREKRQAFKDDLSKIPVHTVIARSIVREQMFHLLHDGHGSS